MRKLTTVKLLMLFLILVSCSSESIDVNIVEDSNSNDAFTDEVNIVEELSVEEERLRLFDLAKYILLDESDDEPNTAIRRWSNGTPVRIFLSGDVTIEHENVVVDLLNDLKDLNTINLDIELTTVENDANVEVYIATFNDLMTLRPDFSPNADEVSRGITTSFRNSNNELTRARIWINNDTFSISTIKHEILHSIGLGHSNDESSVLFTPSQAEELNSDDIFVIEALYGGMLNPGDNEEQIISVLQDLLSM